MAEVSQKLGFDASDALRELDKLDAALKQLNSTLASVGSRGFKAFNTGAGRTVAALKQVTAAAATARRALAGSATLGDFNVNKGVASFTALGQSASKSAASVKKVGTAAKTAGSEAAAAGKKGTAAANGMTVSYGTLARVIKTQLVVRAFGALTRALGDSIRQASEFQKSVSEIATIDVRGGGNLGAISDDVLKLSNAFGVDLGDVGRGLYQTISNQIAQTGTASERAAGQYEFLSQAIKFSIAGVTSVEASVNLLSGTINAFGEDASSVGRISAQFFKTIELGRTTASELANSFATVAPVAAQLGISIEELQASFATITIGGLDTAKAATQIRGAMTALLKPTQAMKDAFEQLGVASGEQLIDLFGFQGGLEAVISTTDGSAQSIAQLIPRIRGLGGALRLASKEGAKIFRDDLRKIIKANEELRDQKFEIVFTTEARQLENDLNRLKNLFTTEFGDKVIEAINKVIAAFGGFDNVSQVFEALLSTLTGVGPILIGTAVLIAAVGVASQLASTKVGALNKSLLLLAAVGAAVALGKFIGSQIRDSLEADNKAIEDALKQRNDFASKEAKRRIETEEATNKLNTIGFKLHLAGLAKLNAGRITDAKRVAQKVREANEDAFNAILGASESLESKLKSQFKAREGQAKTAINNIKGFERDLQDARFEASIRGLGGQARFFALEQKLASQNAAARAALERATQTGDPEAIEEARQAFARTADTVRELTGLAPGLDKALGRSLFQFKADQALESSLSSRLGLEQTLLAIILKRQGVERKAAEEAAENNRKLKDVVAELIEAQSASFETGISPEEQKQRVVEVSNLKKEVLELVKANDKIGADTLAGFVPLLTKGPEQFLTDAQIDRITISESALKDARAQLTQAFAGVQISIGIKTALEKAGITGDLSQADVGEFVAGAVDTNQIIKRLESEIGVLKGTAQNTIESLPDIRELISESFLNRDSRGGKSFSSDLRTAVNSLNVALLVALEDGFVTEKEIAVINEKRALIAAEFAKIGEVDVPAFLGGDFAGDLIGKNRQRNASSELEAQADNMKLLTNLLFQQIEATKQLTTAEAKLKTARAEAAIPSDEARQNVIDTATSVGQQAIKQQEAAAAAAETTQKIKGGANAADLLANKLGIIPQAINQGTSAVTNLQTALNSLTVPDLSVNVGTVNKATGGRVSRLAKGGMAYLADGGFTPQGTDTIPAMLSPGEFVVNARSTRRFFSQLQAMNAGVKPIFRQEGGPVTNVGDINVSVGSGKDSADTGRQIARSLRRELRRNTSSL